MSASWNLSFNFSMASVAIFCGIAAAASVLVGRFVAASDDNASSLSNSINKFSSYSSWVIPHNLNSSGRQTFSALCV